MADVCYHSGMSKDECTYLCSHCASSYVPTPDPLEIQRRAAAVREQWSDWEVNAHSTTPIYPCSVPSVVLVTDHRVRRKEHGFR